MDFLHLLLLSIVQGITEFLPISSSGHLILLPQIMAWQDQGLEIDIAMHIGTLLAVMMYFRRDVLTMALGARDIMTRRDTDNRGLIINLLIATLPVVIFGLILKSAIENDFRSAALVASTSIIFGGILYLADRKAAKNKRELLFMAPIHALYIGLAQALALVPGVSRSGITMTAALFLGYSRTDSARFSLLLSIPTTFAAGVLIAKDLIQSESAAMIKDALISGGMAFVFGYMAIWGMMSWLKQYSFMPFVIYRVALGLVLFAFFVGPIGTSMP